jgi:apolipoprotein D and lipocalin family protein
MRRLIGASLLLMTMTQASATVHTVPAVDLERYAGDWFEVARYPNWFERNCAGDVRASYARRADGDLDVVNRCATNDGSTSEARGLARIVDTQSHAKLQVRFAPAVLSFLPFVWGDYWIIGLADDYTWAVVGSPDRKYLWVLARSPALDARASSRAIDAAAASGFDATRLVWARGRRQP